MEPGLGAFTADEAAALYLVERSTLKRTEVAELLGMSRAELYILLKRAREKRTRLSKYSTPEILRKDSAA